jgi:thiosulfate dehydrogenase (quinone) large subunit
MALITRGARRVPTQGTSPQTGQDAATPAPATGNTIARYAAAAARLSLGWIFLWAFIDKTFGLGYATESKNAWIDGGSPTNGFLKFAATGPFKDTYNDIAGATWADWLFMTGLLGIGIALLAGIAMRIATATGALLLILMWSAVLPPENNPFMDDHIVYAILLLLLTALGAGKTLGLGTTWENLPIVKRHPILK